MDGTQTLVAAGAVGLLLANELHPVPGSPSARDRGVFSGVLWNGKDPQAAHTALVRLGAEVVAVAVAVLLAGMGNSWPTMVLVAIVALWVLYLMRRSGMSVSPGANAGAQTA